jgi:hypothetical protein
MGGLPRISVRRAIAAVVVLAVVSYHFAGGLNTYVVTLSYGNRASAALTLLACDAVELGTEATITSAFVIPRNMPGPLAC